ncbi:MAG: aldo/keto reductase [Clostridiales bacterium]|jgi:predicted aldo/keto reductase-like oxidoreductase|nr:aldo/keto reductase [Clostridiales bacterium]
MIYREMPKTKDKISVLGYGCMRFPRKSGIIDEARTERQVAAAVERGVNYFDTAYIYPGSEKTLGKVLVRQRLRNHVMIATKLPAMFVKDKRHINEIFEKQLERLQTDHIDYYLIHNLSSLMDFGRLREKGIEDFIAKEQARGRIRAIGFSFHGNLREFRLIVDAYPWDFCQIQYNYLDEHFQAGTEGLNYAAENGLGVIAMEPLRGGMLGDQLPQEARRLFEADVTHAGRSPAEWGLRWVWSHPGVVAALSGMNDESHIEENTRIASEIGNAAADLSATEHRMIAVVKEFFDRHLRVPCTGCAYCMPCPFGVDIPTCFSWYNRYGVRKSFFAKAQYIIATEGVVNGQPSKASLCRNCGTCEKRCPQQIPIRSQLKAVAAEMEGALLRVPISTALRLFHKK